MKRLWRNLSPNTVAFEVCVGRTTWVTGVRRHYGETVRQYKCELLSRCDPASGTKSGRKQRSWFLWNERIFRRRKWNSGYWIVSTKPYKRLMFSFKELAVAFNWWLVTARYLCVWRFGLQVETRPLTPWEWLKFDK